MKTKLTFEAPGDLSVGRVLITGADGRVGEWVATPADRTLVRTVKPGFFTASIAPAGVPPQSVVFEVKAGREQFIKVPPFSSLAASGGNTTFLGITDKGKAIDALFAKPAKVMVKPPVATAALGAKGPPRAFVGREVITAAADVVELPDVPSIADDRRLSIGLSIDRSGMGSFRPYPAKVDLELSEGRLQLTVDGTGELLAHRERVRLSLAVEGVRVERLMLPMFRGGVQVDVMPSPLSVNDVDLHVLPSDASLRALVRALTAGTTEDAKAVRSLIEKRHEDSSERDVWEDMLVALLAARFPDVFDSVPIEMVHRLLAHAPWAYESYVINARCLLFTAGGDRAEAAREALEVLRRGHATGSPYFSYTNQLFSDLIEGLLAHFERHGPSQLRKKANRLRARWIRDQPLASNAGAVFSWLRRDQQLLKRGILTADRSPSGGLSHRSTAVVFSGRIASGRISYGLREQMPPESGLKEIGHDQVNVDVDDGPICPANGRPVMWRDDPNLERFGGEGARDGYALTARFEDELEEGVTNVTLTVEAGPDAGLIPGDVAWFCLHPTFRPQWVRVIFGNGRAVLTVQAWGGFTVGAWLPTPAVELELDLSRLPDAPKRIREL